MRALFASALMVRNSRNASDKGARKSVKYQRKLKKALENNEDMKKYAAHFSNFKTLYYITKDITPGDEARRLIEFKTQILVAFNSKLTIVISSDTTK